MGTAEISLLKVSVIVSVVAGISPNSGLVDTRVVSAFAFVKPRRAKQSVKSK